LPTFSENFMQTHSEVFANRQTDRQTCNDDDITSLAEAMMTFRPGACSESADIKK